MFGRASRIATILWRIFERLQSIIYDLQRAQALPTTNGLLQKDDCIRPTKNQPLRKLSTCWQNTSLDFTDVFQWRKNTSASEKQNRVRRDLPKVAFWARTFGGAFSQSSHTVRENFEQSDTVWNQKEQKFKPKEFMVFNLKACQE